VVVEPEMNVAMFIQFGPTTRWSETGRVNLVNEQRPLDSCTEIGSPKDRHANRFYRLSAIVSGKVTSTLIFVTARFR
jgi:hypothetical protein